VLQWGGHRVRFRQFAECECTITGERETVFQWFETAWHTDCGMRAPARHAMGFAPQHFGARAGWIWQAVKQRGPRLSEGEGPRAFLVWSCIQR
jgi:hypothetical protein